MAGRAGKKKQEDGEVNNQKLRPEGKEKVTSTAVNTSPPKKQASETLRQPEERYRTILEQMDEAYYEVDLAGNLTFFNDATCRQLGYSKEDLTGMNYRVYTSKDDVQRVYETFAQVYRTGKPCIGFAVGRIRKDGTLLFTENSALPLRNDGGKIIGFRGVARDVTERKQIQEALHRSEEKYRLLADNASDVIWIADMNLNTTYISPSIYAMQGHTPEEAMNLTIEQRFTPESLEKVSKILMEALANEEAGREQPNNLDMFEAEYIRKDGSTYWTETRASFIRNGAGKVVGMLGVTRDISARKQAEEALRKSEGQYHLLAEHTLDGVLLLDMNLKITYVSPNVEKMRGFTPLEATEMSLEKHLTPGSLKLASELFLEEIPKVEADPDYNPVRILELEYYCKDGTTILTESKFSIIRDPGGKAVSILGEARDITERKQADEALARSEERYRTILENMQDSYIEVDLAGNFTFINEATCSNLGYTMKELIGQNFSIITPGQDEVKAIFEAYNEVYKTGEPYMGFAFRVIRKDGLIGYAEVSISLIKNEQGRPIGFRSVGRDVTERKQLEQKLEEMATHDFLTGLPNRVLLLDRFNIVAALARRNKARLAVMSLDLDNFKSINDTLGHDIGDLVLKAVSKRFMGIIRASDTVARVGGDEFILVMLETKHMEDATAIAQKILDSFIEPLSIDGHQLYLSSSIGIAIYPEDAEDMETMIKKSDAAMYYSKGHGGNQFKFSSDGCPH